MEKEYIDLTAQEVKAFMAQRREGSYQLLDVRFEEEYTEEHLPGSLLITLDQLEERMEEGSLPMCIKATTVLVFVVVRFINTSWVVHRCIVPGWLVGATHDPTFVIIEKATDS